MTINSTNYVQNITLEELEEDLQNHPNANPYNANNTTSDDVVVNSTSGLKVDTQENAFVLDMDVVNTKCSDNKQTNKPRGRKIKQRSATVPMRGIIAVDFSIFPEGTNLKIQNKDQACWAQGIDYTINGQYISKGESHVYTCADLKSEICKRGFLEIDEEMLVRMVKDARIKIQTANAEGRSYDYKNDIPITAFSHKQGNQCGGITETVDLTDELNPIVLDIQLNRPSAILHYQGELADQVWNLKNHWSGRISKSILTTFSNDPNEDTLNLCPIDKYKDGQLFDEAEMLDKYKTPAWDEWLFKYSKKAQEYIMAWIWSLVDASTNSCEVLWLRSEGGDGKTTFVNALTKGLDGMIIRDKSDQNNSVVHSINSNSESLNDPHASASYYDKRLLYFPECKNKNLMRTSLVHQLSGGEPISINPKYKQGMTVKPKINMLVTSNDYPTIANENNLLRRLLYVSPREDWEPIGNRKDNSFEGKLINEFDTLLFKCKFYYDKCISAGNGYIQPVDEKLSWLEGQDLMSGSCDANYDLLFAEDAYSQLSLKEIQRTITYLNSELKGAIKFEYDVRAVKTYMKQRFNKTKLDGLKRVDGQMNKTYKGVRMKSSAEIIGILEGSQGDAVLETVNNYINGPDVFDV